MPDDSFKGSIFLLDLLAVCDGEIIPIEEVDDAIFAQKLVGDGYGIIPTGDVVYSPVDARIDQIAATKHAVYLALAGGQKILIHIGLDTIELKGEGFATDLENGDRVSKGDRLIRFDRQEIIAKGYNPVINVVLLDVSSQLELTVYPEKQAKALETLAASLDKVSDV